MENKAGFIGVSERRKRKVATNYTVISKLMGKKSEKNAHSYIVVHSMNSST